MPRHRRAEDVGNLSGQPNPPLLTLVYVSTFKHACAQEVGRAGGFLQESLSPCRQSRRSQTSQCQWLY